MAKLLMTFLLLALTPSQVDARESVTFNGQFWHKHSCQQQDEACLPQASGPVQRYSMEKPTFGNVTRLQIAHDHYRAVLLWRYHRGQPDYFSFQIELSHRDGGPIALCSRFEKIDERMRHIPVGACAGALEDGRLFGLTLLL